MNANPAQIKATALWASLANTVQALKTAAMQLEGDAQKSALYAVTQAEEKLLKHERIA